MKYYGLIDIENLAYGFLEEDDSRITPDMLQISDEEWNNLLEEQGMGKEIVYYNGELFATDEIGRYYINQDGEWSKYTLEEYNSNITNNLLNEFKNNFFEVEGYGWYRKKPKGYTSAIESLNVVANAISLGINVIPAETFTFYKKPDISDPSQFTEEWLTNNQIKSSEMTALEFANFYMKFTQAWNNIEHK